MEEALEKCFNWILNNNRSYLQQWLCFIEYLLYSRINVTHQGKGGRTFQAEGETVELSKIVCPRSKKFGLANGEGEGDQ